VAGFKSGVLRIFDIETTSIIQEICHHESPIVHVEYSRDGHFLAVLEERMNMLYSPLHNHQPIKHLNVDVPSKYKHSCFSTSCEQLFVIGEQGTHVQIWDLKTLQMLGKIFTNKVIKKLKYIDQRLWVIFEDTSVRRYNLDDYTIEVEMQALHRESTNGIDFNSEDHLLYSVGEDSLLKVWDYSFLREPHQVNIGHAGCINDVVYNNNRVWTIGSEGVLVWDAVKPNEEFIPPPVFKK
jgi:WD40 repeat protein